MSDKRSSPERRVHQSAIMRARWADPQERARLQRRMVSRSNRAKARAATKARWADPEMRAKMIAGMRTTTKRVRLPSHDSGIVFKAGYYRKQAERTRQEAIMVANESVRRELLLIATKYEDLARLVDAMDLS